MKQRTVIKTGFDNNIVVTQEVRDINRRFMPKTIGGIAKTNRIVRTNQSLEAIGFFQCERSTAQRDQRRSKRN